MRISYRASAISLLITLTILIAIESPMLSPPVAEPIRVCFDPRFMWRQVRWTEWLSVIVWLGSLIVLLLFGLGNHRARWSAIVNLITLAQNIRYQYWWILSSCSTPLDIVARSTCVVAIAIVCLQHILNGQPPIQN